MKRDLVRSALALILILGGEIVALPAPAQSIESDRQQIESWLKTKYPSLGAGDYARGEAAFGESTTQRASPAQLDEALARGKALWQRQFKNGKNLASCFPNGGKRVAASYPQFDPKAGRVITFSDAINRCLRLHGQPEVDFASDANAGEMLAYAQSLSKGLPTNIRVPGKEAQAQYDLGKKLFYARLGSRNQACASCHVLHAGEVMERQVLSAAIGQTVNWPRIAHDGTVTTLQAQYQKCFRRVGAEAPAIGSAVMNSLEYFHSSLSARIPLGR